MYPIMNYDLVRSIHEDRIRAARRPVPEWMMYVKASESSPRLNARVRSSIAGALRRLAVAVDPQRTPATV